MRFTELKLSYRPYKLSPPINNSSDAYSFFRKVWDKGKIELQEQVYVIFLNGSNEAISWHCFNTGNCDESIVDVKLIVGVSLIAQACSVIIAHNHPSGTLVSSSRDYTITARLNSALELIDTRLADHLIVNRVSYFSFVDNDILMR